MATESSAHKTKAHDRVSMGLVECHFRKREKPNGKGVADSSIDRRALPHRATGVIFFDRFVLLLGINDCDVSRQRYLRIEFMDD